MGIKKSEVHEALCKMEEHLYGFNHEGNPNMPIPLRLLSVLGIAYTKNSYPPESVVVLDSYRLLELEGHYYNEDC